MIALQSSSLAQALVGGLMIGSAAAIVLLVLGRVSGVSGLAARAVGAAAAGAPGSVAVMFVMGLPLGALTIAALIGQSHARFPGSLALLVAAGLLVGFGTRLGSGCTSGHGVCGVSRLSRRSIIATAVFMAFGIATVTVADRLGSGW